MLPYFIAIMLTYLIDIIQLITLHQYYVTLLPEHTDIMSIQIYNINAIYYFNVIFLCYITGITLHPCNLTTVITFCCYMKIIMLHYITLM